MTSATIFDIKRFAVHDGPGIRTTVFLKGCPLDCWWCHNPESRRREPEEVTYMRKLGDLEIESTKVYGKVMAVRQLIREILKDKVFYEESGGGVTFSGGEPLHQPVALLELLQACYKQGLHTTVDTCGYAQWSVFENILPYTDLFLFDLKIMDPEKHWKFTGIRNNLILENLEKLLKNRAAVELRIPFIPGVNDDEKEVNRYLTYLQDKKGKIAKIHLLPYHEIADNKYQKLNIPNRMKDLKAGDGMDIEDFRNRLGSLGFEVGIGG
jgi:pyruvate formate lyase activating enzyme